MKNILKRGFKPAECKTALHMANSRLEILKNKKEIQIKYLRRELAQLLESGHTPTARIRVEHVVREEKTMAAYELIGIYCEVLVTRLNVIESQKNCPIDLKEAVAGVLFASLRLSEVPELAAIEKQFTIKYGKKFAKSAIELRPDSGVSRLLVEKLSAKAPDNSTKLKILIEIARAFKVVWDAKYFVETERHHSSENSTSWCRTDEKECINPNHHGHGYENSTSRSKHRWGWGTQFIDSTDAAQAAIEAAERASFAARAAAELLRNETHSLNFRNEPSHRSQHVQCQSFSEEGFFPRQNVTMSPTSPIFHHAKLDNYGSNSESDDDQPRHSGKVIGDVHEKMNRVSDQSKKFDSRTHDSEADAKTGLTFRRLISGFKNKNTHKIRGRDDVGQCISTFSTLYEDEEQVKRVNAIPTGYSVRTKDHKKVTPSKERASHVHPKLPDYDDIIAKFTALRAANRH